MTTQPTSFEDQDDDMVRDDIQVDVSDNEESADVSTKKGFKAISKEMC